MTRKLKYEELEQRVKALESDAIRRQKAGEALRDSEERFRCLSEATFEGIVIHEKGMVLRANDQFFEMLGYKPDELIGKQMIPMIIAPESVDFIREQIDSGVTTSYEVLGLKKDGTKFPLEIHAKPMGCQERMIRVAAMRDISDRKQAEERLRKAHDELERRVEERTLEVVTANELLRREIAIRKRSEEALTKSRRRFMELWDDAPVSYHTVDTKGVVTQVNQTETGMLGYSKEEMLGKPIFDFILPEQRLEAEARFQLKLRGEKIPRHDDRIYVKKDGSRIYVSIDDVVEYDSEGKVVSVRTTMVDVTEGKEAEKALHRVNRALRVLSNCNEVLIHASDELGFMNEACRILVEDGGYRFAWVGFAERDQDKTVRPVAQKGFEDGYLEAANITWADTERGRGPTGKAIRTKKPSIVRNILQDPDFAPWREAASERGYASSIALPFIAENRSIGALNIYANEPDAFDAEEVHLLSNLALDLTYGLMSLRAKAELRRLSAQLISIQETERKTISRELHDSIGQSLVAIKFGLENTVEKMRHGMDQESFELLEALIPLVQQSGEEVRRIHTDLRPSLLDDLGILATISWFCRQFEKVYSDIRVEKHIEIEENDVPESLKIIIFRILQEALNNVAKYSKADLVSVSSTRTEDRLEFAVQDNGQGFDPQSIYSLKSGDRGFGIANMKERAELSGGSFSIESSHGSGATVRVSWPNEGNKSK